MKSAEMLVQVVNDDHAGPLSSGPHLAAGFFLRTARDASAHIPG
jgi:hypothetical protein